MKEICYQVTNPLGIHARCASLFAQTAAPWKSAVTMTCKNRSVNGKQVLDILDLSVVCGDEVIIQAEGVDEAEAIQSLSGLLPKLFG